MSKETVPDYKLIRQLLDGRPSPHVFAVSEALPAPNWRSDGLGTLQEKKNFVDILVEQNQDMWNELLNNEFCQKMAVSKEDVDPAFQEYCEQDYASLWAWVRFMALRASAEPEIQRVIHGAATIAGMQHYAMDWKELVMVNFGSRGYDIDAKKLTFAMAEYIRYMTEESQLAAKNRDTFRLRVVMTPCIEGYYRISKNLAENPPDGGLSEFARCPLMLSHHRTVFEPARQAV